MTPLLPDGAVADLLVVLGAIARIVTEADPPEVRLQSIRRALANVGINAAQTRTERLATLRRACGRARPRRRTESTRSAPAVRLSVNQPSVPRREKESSCW